MKMRPKTKSNAKRTGRVKCENAFDSPHSFLAHRTGFEPATTKRRRLVLYPTELPVHKWHILFARTVDVLLQIVNAHIVT